MANEIRIKAILDDKVSGGLDKIRDRFDTLGKSKGFQSVIQGIGIGAGISAYGLLDRAISGVIGIVGDSIHASLADEAARQRLTTAIRANVVAWDGSTAAMDRAFKAGINLGFSDDEQADSLARLVAATHDINKALTIQATAEDLARFKKISLADATDALVSIDAGRARGLANLGINVKNFSTIEERLTAVQKVAAGQASDYAKIDEGKLLVAQTKVNEAEERFGYTIMPGVIDVVVAAADTVVMYADTLDHLEHLTTLTAAEQTSLADSLVDLARRGFLPLDLALHGIDFSLDKLGIHFDLFAGDAPVKMSGMADQVGKSADDVVSSFDDMGIAAVDFRDTFKDVAGAVIRSSNRIRSKFEDDAQGLIDGYFDSIELAGELWDIRMQLLADREALRKSKSAADSTRAKNAIVQDLDDQATKLIALSGQGALTAAQVAQFERDAAANYASLGATGRTQLDTVIARLRTLAGIKNINVNVHYTASGVPTVGGRGSAAPGHGHLEYDFDEGGMVPGPKGQPVAAVVHGGEYVLPPDSYRLSHTAPMMDAGGPVTINVQVDGQTLASIVDRNLYYRRQTAAGR